MVNSTICQRANDISDNKITLKWRNKQWWWWWWGWWWW